MAEYWVEQIDFSTLTTSPKQLSLLFFCAVIRQMKGGWRFAYLSDVNDTRMKHQHGVALLTALLVVALATSAAVAMFSRQQLDIRRSAVLLHGDQAYLYALGAEAWARQVLQRDNNRHDHRGEVWAIQLPPTTVEGGELSGHLEDLQGKFNLNNLLTPEGQPSATDVRIFTRLLHSLGLPERIAQAALDWMDSDILPSFPNGAEDEEYLRQELPYRTANQLFSDVSELRLLAGVDQDGYLRLLPYLTALPVRTHLNVNTLSPLLLQAVIVDLSLADAETLLNDPPTNGYDNITDFLQLETLAGLEVEANTLDVASNWFQLYAEARIEQNYALLNSILHRQQGKVTVLHHSRIW